MDDRTHRRFRRWPIPNAGCPKSKVQSPTQEGMSQGDEGGLPPQRGCSAGDPGLATAHSSDSQLQTPDSRLCWRLYGNKWFASAITSQIALTLARPEGNPPGGRGLALFYL